MSFTPTEAQAIRNKMAEIDQALAVQRQYIGALTETAVEFRAQLLALTDAVNILTEELKSAKGGRKKA